MVSAPVLLAGCGSSEGPPVAGDGLDATAEADTSFADGSFPDWSVGDAVQDARKDAKKTDGASGGGGSDGPGEAGSDDTGRYSGFDAGPCVPGCPADVTCGLWTDCTGNTLACGAPCTAGNVCVESNTFPPQQSCQPLACTGKCGVLGVDACNVPISCGGCPKGDDCVKNACVPSSSIDAGPTDACPPLTCTPGSFHLCGDVTDGCGHTLDCSCPTGQECFGGVCGAPPPECAASEAGTRCGSIENACGSGNVACGGCTGTTKCESNICTSCTPPTCGTATCGSVNNGCGPSVSCGTCTGKDESCYDGACCTHSTCGDLIDAGTVKGCTTVSLGCGLTESCLPCASGYTCDEGTGSCAACVPKTCANFDSAGCDLSDGCGHTLNCCTTGTTCAQGLCCSPGEVNYDGSCCAPACNPSLPNGPQVSCGVTIYCGE
jgi:hypothetical protein